jgi:hypothetical protein
MRSFEPAFLIFMLTMAALGITALLIHGIWIAPFLERHGRMSAGFFAHWFSGTGLMQDYGTAQTLCRELGIYPWWLRTLKWLLLSELVLLIGLLGSMGFWLVALQG